MESSAGMPQLEKSSTSLNLDIIRAVMTFSSVADLKELAIVSHPLQEEAFREILTRGVYLQSKPTRLRSFCQFMLTRDPPLYSFLHKVIVEHIPDRASDEFDPKDLLEVLARTTSLRDLRIRWCDHLFTTQSDKRLSEILPQLQDLRRLEIWTKSVTTDPLVADTVLRLRSQLHNLHFSADEDNQLPRDFPNLLAERQQSLHQLRICYPDLTSTPWAPFPTLRVLYLTISSKIPSLPHLAQIFPNLRELAVSAVGFEVDFFHPAPQHVRAREEALAFQARGGGWRSLDVLTTTTIGDPWVLCLACPVGSVRLGHYDVGSHAAFVDVVSRTRPRKVILHLACTSYCIRPSIKPSIFVFPPSADPSKEGGAGPQGATHAVLPFTIASFSQDQTTSSIVDVIDSHIGDSRLEYLHIAFAEFFMFTPEIDERVLRSRDIHPRCVEFIKEIDVDLLVRQVAAAATHLRVLVVTVATRDQSVWMVEQRGGARIPIRVEDMYSARQIIEREERAYLHPSYLVY